jgi:hypothetical protein
MLGFSLLAGSVTPAHTGLDRRKTKLNEFLPWFIVDLALAIPSSALIPGLLPVITRVDDDRDGSMGTGC